MKGGDVRVWARVLVVLALVLPIGGYVVLSLAAGPTQDPAPRAPMQLRPADAPGTSGGDGPDLRTPTSAPVPVAPRLGDRDDDRDEDQDNDRDRDDGGDDDRGADRDDRDDEDDEDGD